MISAVKYYDTDKDIWNQFNKNSKMPMFMFNRNYMDYHKDRFTDNSLLFYNDEKELIALFPACIVGNTLQSHGGLTFGGFISDSKMKQHTMNECFDALIAYMEDSGISKLIYKTIPHIYHFFPAEEDRYSLFAKGGIISTIDASTTIELNNPIKMPKGRKAQIARAKREGVIIEELFDFKDYEAFIDLENEVLLARHNTKAVHSADELKKLHDFFPDNIHLFGAKKSDKLIAGTVIYEYDTVIHTQYMAANDEARVIGALDYTISTVIDKYRTSKKWLDFGISTEHGRIYLNEGLIAQKESFGGRTGVYGIWELNLKRME